MSTLHIHTKSYSRLTPIWHSHFPSSTLTAGMQPWIRVRVELFLPPPPHPPDPLSRPAHTGKVWEPIGIFLPNLLLHKAFGTVYNHDIWFKVPLGGSALGRLEGDLVFVSRQAWLLSTSKSSPKARAKEGNPPLWFVLCVLDMGGDLYMSYIKTTCTTYL